MDDKFPVRDEELAFLDATLSRACGASLRWRMVCDQLTRLAGGVGTVMVPLGANMGGRSLTSSESLHNALRAYQAEAWFKSDPRQELDEFIIERGYAFDTDIYPVRTLEHLPFYSDFLAPHGLGGMCAVHFCVGASDWFAAVQFAVGHYEARSGFVENIPRIREALTKAAGATMAAAVEQWRAIAATANAMGEAVIPVDRLGRVCADLVGQEEALFVEGLFKDIPEALIYEMYADVNKWLESAAQLPPPPRIYAVSDKQSFAGSCHAPPDLLKFFALNVGGILRVSKTQPKVNPVFAFAERAGLTPAEIRVVEGLCAGENLKKIAYDQNLKEGTVRQQLKSVFRKTNAATQHQLLSMVFTLG